jgi:hypothetical protein
MQREKSQIHGYAVGFTIDGKIQGIFGLDALSGILFIFNEQSGQRLAQILVRRVHDFLTGKIIRDDTVQADFMHTYLQKVHT